MPTTVAAAFEAMKIAETRFRAERTDAARAAYLAANAAYNALNPPRGSFHSRDMSPAARSGRRQHAEQAARTAAAVARQSR